MAEDKTQPHRQTDTQTDKTNTESTTIKQKKNIAHNYPHIHIPLQLAKLLVTNEIFISSCIRKKFYCRPMLF